MISILLAVTAYVFITPILIIVLAIYYANH